MSKYYIINKVLLKECDDALQLPNHQFAAKLMDNEDFVNYIKKHGYHFTPALAEHASKQMTNADGSQHSWTTDQVRTAMTTAGHKLERNNTWGDATYLANMAYADFYPELLKKPEECITYAHLTIADPDGYDGLAFSRWLSDVVTLHISIDWEYYSR